MRVIFSIYRQSVDSHFMSLQATFARAVVTVKSPLTSS